MHTDKRIVMVVLSVVLLLGGRNLWADEPGVHPADLALPELESTQWESTALESTVAKTYLLGVSEFEADDFTTITGWRLSNSWYFGHQDGEEDSGLSLVWQQQRDQMSISSEGIRFTRRF